jgi:hypothetical protein
MNPTKRNKIVYWIVTVWLALGLVSTGIPQFIRMDEEVENMARLGYPAYFMVILGTWKFLATIAVLVPKFPLIKEWAYAGIFFAMTGATISRIASHEPVSAALPSLFLLTLAMLSWYFRPADRKVVPANQ